MATDYSQFLENIMEHSETLTAVEIIQLIQHNATREDIKELRDDMRQDRKEFRDDMQQYRKEFHDDMQQYRISAEAKFDKLLEQIGDVNTSLSGRINQVNTSLITEIATVATIASETKSKLNWTIAILLTIGSGLLALSGFIITHLNQISEALAK
jgi:hypothetical protein